MRVKGQFGLVPLGGFRCLANRMIDVWMTGWFAEFFPQNHGTLDRLCFCKKLFWCIALGIDMLVCVTRAVRNSMLFTTQGIISIRNEKWKEHLIMMWRLGGHVKVHSTAKAYLRHLIINKEILGAQIWPIHNPDFLSLAGETGSGTKFSGHVASGKSRMVKIMERLAG